MIFSGLFCIIWPEFPSQKWQVVSSNTDTKTTKYETCINTMWTSWRSSANTFTVGVYSQYADPVNSLSAFLTHTHPVPFDKHMLKDSFVLFRASERRLLPFLCLAHHHTHHLGVTTVSNLPSLICSHNHADKEELPLCYTKAAKCENGCLRVKTTCIHTSMF